MNSRGQGHRRCSLAAAGMVAILLAASPTFASDGRVSEGMATWASALGTLVPMAAGFVVGAADPEGSTLRADLLDAGLLAGPSLGHFYAREPKRALFGVGVRAAGFAVFFMADNLASGTGEAAIGTLGFGVVVASVLHDIVSAKKSAREHNEEIERQGARAAPLLQLASRSLTIGVRLEF